MSDIYDMYDKEAAARKAGLERIAEVQQFLDALKSEFEYGALMEIYVNEKTDSIRAQLKSLDRLAAFRKDR